MCVCVCVCVLTYKNVIYKGKPQGKKYRVNGRSSSSRWMTGKMRTTTHTCQALCLLEKKETKEKHQYYAISLMLLFTFFVVVVTCMKGKYWCYHY